LSELGRLRLARAIVERGWPVARAAERLQVSRSTVFHRAAAGGHAQPLHHRYLVESGASTLWTIRG
jgi:hypothetical protein